MKKTKHLEEKFLWAEKALTLQAEEYERRLNALNGEAGRLREMQSTYIPREVFDRSLQQQNEKFERVVNDLKDRIEVLTAYNLKAQGLRQFGTFIPWIISIVAIIVMYYLNK